MVRAINAPAGTTPQQILGDLSAFSTPLYSVRCLAASLQEERQAETPNFNLADRDWRWRADDVRGEQPSTRANCASLVVSVSLRTHARCGESWLHRQLRNVSQGMLGARRRAACAHVRRDATAMALHCVWSTKSATAALVKVGVPGHAGDRSSTMCPVRQCANLRGDCDSVCAVVGQLAGAFYGLSAFPDHWIAAQQEWDKVCTALCTKHAHLFLHHCRETWR
jgi:ADP-ribosylglycohydrolase